MAELTTHHAGTAARPRPHVTRRARSHDLLEAAVVAGLLAGAAMLAWAALSAWAADAPPARPLALAAATFAGDASGLGAVLGGAVVWAAVSVLLALLFGAIIPRDYPFVSAALMGVAYAFVLLGVVTSSALPRWNPDLLAAMVDAGGAWVLAFAAFGVALGVLPSLRRRFAGT